MNTIPSPPEDTKEIEGYEGFYRVGRDGSVWSCYPKGRRKIGQRAPWRKMTPVVHAESPTYFRHSVMLRKPGEYKHFGIHQLVARAFIGPCPEGMECRHKDGNAENNNVENLAWSTRMENQHDRIAHGTTNRGERGGGSKLRTDEVLEIRKLYRSGQHTLRSLGKLFGVTGVCIHYICAAKSWNHI